MFCLEVYKKSDVKPVELPKLAKDGSNKGDFFATETLVSKKFAQNFGGYPRSDIAIINEQQNINVARAMLEQLTDYSQSASGEQKSDVELMLAVQSKYMQSPSEILPFIENELSNRDASVAASQFQSFEQSSSVDVNEVIDNA